MFHKSQFIKKKLEIFAVWIYFTLARSNRLVKNLVRFNLEMCTTLGFCFIIITLIVAVQGSQKQGTVRPGWFGLGKLQETSTIYIQKKTSLASLAPSCVKSDIYWAKLVVRLGSARGLLTSRINAFWSTDSVDQWVLMCQQTKGSAGHHW